MSTEPSQENNSSAPVALFVAMTLMVVFVGYLFYSSIESAGRNNFLSRSHELVDSVKTLQNGKNAILGNVPSELHQNGKTNLEVLKDWIGTPERLFKYGLEQRLLTVSEYNYLLSYAKKDNYVLAVRTSNDYYSTEDMLTLVPSADEKEHKEKIAQEEEERTRILKEGK